MAKSNKVWNPMCMCGHRAKRHRSDNRRKTADPWCDDCECGMFDPKHEPARASDWTKK